MTKVGQLVRVVIPEEAGIENHSAQNKVGRVIELVDTGTRFLEENKDLLDALVIIDYKTHFLNRNWLQPVQARK